jgi:8-oxo-dGTP pyrophosphatase MutT (NUDIX family)
VLLVKRNPEQRFMGGAWVFPGGAVHDEDGGHAGTALRELEEEAGIRIADPAALVPYSRWITPEEVKVRFDTWFFLAEAPPDAEARPDGGECVEARWLRPRAALEEGARGELMLVFPTIKHLEQLAEHRSVRDAVEVASAREVRPVQPRVVVGERGAEVLLPGEPGYEG